MPWRWRWPWITHPWIEHYENSEMTRNISDNLPSISGIADEWDRGEYEGCGINSQQALLIADVRAENAKLLAANGDLANLIGKREAEVARLKAALEASKEYTELLGKAEADALGLLHIHGYKVSADMVRRGAELRLRIAALSEEMK